MSGSSFDYGLRNNRSTLRSALFLLFCTRPDAAFYFWIPAVLFGLGARDGRWQRALCIYIAAFLPPWLLLTIFRGVYFHDVFPNTFHTKQGEGAKIFGWMLTHMPLPWVVAVVMVVGTLVIGACGWGFHALGQRLGSRLGPEFGRRYGLVLLFSTAYGIVLALPGDWMLEHRFATPMFLFGPAAGMALLWELLARVGPRTRTVLVGIAAAAGLGAAGVYSARHTPAFVRAPTLGFEICRHVVDIARRHSVRKAVKSKSMLSEEAGLNQALAASHVQPVETDLGEYILQINGNEPPSHIIAPVVHKSKEEIAPLRPGAQEAATYRHPRDDPRGARGAAPALPERRDGHLRRQLPDRRDRLGGAGDQRGQWPHVHHHARPVCGGRRHRQGHPGLGIADGLSQAIGPLRHRSKTFHLHPVHHRAPPGAG